MRPEQHTINTPYAVGSVHCYTAELNGELVLFDTGPPSSEAKQHLVQHVELKKLRHVIITHCHIDHYGLAQWLEQETDADIYLPFRDYLRNSRHHESLVMMTDLMAQYGFSAEILDPFQCCLNNGSIFPPLPKRAKIIEEDLPKHLGLTAISCAGHSQSDMVLMGDDWAITGDVLLQGIFQTPLLDVDLLTGERFRNYDAYCDSLIKLAGLRGKHILPGHQYKIDSVDSCLLFYIEKLLERAVKIKSLPLNMTAAEIVTKLFVTDTQNPFSFYFKASGIVFIRDFLAQPELLKSALVTIGLFAEVADKFEKVVTY